MGLRSLMWILWPSFMAAAAGSALIFALIDPLDGLGWLEALEAATRRRPIAPAYSAPTWQGHFRSIEDHLMLPLAANALAG